MWEAAGSSRRQQNLSGWSAELEEQQGTLRARSQELEERGQELDAQAAELADAPAGEQSPRERAVLCARGS